MTTPPFPEDIEDIEDIEDTQRWGVSDPRLPGRFKGQSSKSRFGPEQFRDTGQTVMDALRHMKDPPPQIRDKNLIEMGQFLRLTATDPREIEATLLRMQRKGMDLNEEVDRETKARQATQKIFEANPVNKFRQAGGNFIELQVALQQGMIFGKHSTAPQILAAMEPKDRNEVLKRAGYTPDDIETFNDQLALGPRRGFGAPLALMGTGFALAGGLFEQAGSNLAQFAGLPGIPGTIDLDEYKGKSLSERWDLTRSSGIERGEEFGTPAYFASLVMPFPGAGLARATTTGVRAIAATPKALAAARAAAREFATAAAKEVAENPAKAMNLGWLAVRGGVDDAVRNVSGAAHEAASGVKATLRRERVKKNVLDGFDDPMTDPSSVNEILQIAVKGDLISDMVKAVPGLKHVGMLLDPAIGLTRANLDALSPGELGTILKVVRGELRHEGAQKSIGAFQSLAALGSQSKIFGNTIHVTAVGKRTRRTVRHDTLILKDAKWENATVGDIVSNPSKFASRMSDKQKAWVKAAAALEDAKLAFFRRNGIKIDELAFDEGGRYASRRVVGRYGVDGELVEYGFVEAPGFGAKLPQEQRRIFKTEKEAIDAGYKVLPYEDSLLLNMQGAYNRVADQRVGDWIFDNLVSRNLLRHSSADAGLVIKANSTRRRVAKIDTAIKRIQSVRGGSGGLPAATVKAIESLSDELVGKLSPVARITLKDLTQAGAQAFKPAVKLPIPTAGGLNKLQRLLTKAVTKAEANPENIQLQTDATELANRLGFANFRFAKGKAILGGDPATKGFTETGEFLIVQNPTKLLNAARKTTLDEILVVLRGTPNPLKKGKPRTFSGGLMETAKAEALAAKKARADSAAHARTPGPLEVAVSKTPLGKVEVEVGTFRGKIIGGEGKEGIEIAKSITAALGLDAQNGLIKALGAANQVNSVYRFFKLAGDASLFGIQLIFLAGDRPAAFAKSIRGFVRALYDPTFHARHLYDNRVLIQKTKTMILAKNGTEFTEAMGRGGFLQTGPLSILGKPLKPFQRAFESGMDVAGIEMRKSLDHLATTPERIRDVENFINEFRGLSSSARLGVSTTQRLVESVSFLAPRYNRAIAALFADLAKGPTTFRGQLAWKALVKGTIGLYSTVAVIEGAMAMNDGVEFGSDEFWDRIMNRLNPGSSDFLMWTIGGQRVGPGSKVRSVVNVLAKTAEDPSSLFDKAMSNPAFRFLRGNLAFVPQGLSELATGEDFLGREVTLDQTLLGVPLPNMRFVFQNLPIPLALESAIFEGGDIQGRATRFATEFFGGRSHPEGAFDIRDEHAREFSKHHAKFTENDADYPPEGVDFDALSVPHQQHVKEIEQVKLAFGRYSERFELSSEETITGMFDEKKRKNKVASDLLHKQIIGTDLDNTPPAFGGSLGEAIRTFLGTLWKHSNDMRNNADVQDFFAGSDRAEGLSLRDNYAEEYRSVETDVDPITNRPDFTDLDEKRKVVLDAAIAAGVDPNYITGVGKGTYSEFQFPDPVVKEAVEAYREWRGLQRDLNWHNIHRDLLTDSGQSIWTKAPEWLDIYEGYLLVTRTQDAPRLKNWYDKFADVAYVTSTIKRIDAKVDEAQDTLRKHNPELDRGFARFTERGVFTEEGLIEAARVQGAAAQLGIIIDKPGGRITKPRWAALVDAVEDIEELANLDPGALVSLMEGTISHARAVSYIGQARTILAAREAYPGGPGGPQDPRAARNAA